MARYMKVGNKVIDVLSIDAPTLDVGAIGRSIVYYDKGGDRHIAILDHESNPKEVIKELVDAINEFDRHATSSLSDDDVRRIANEVFKLLREKISK